uniref:CCHC-type domain-containing protein n=2 Tax=Caenorhabditis japonica TaxID=281687 RepID=A0A8R1DMR2_CAEJA
MFKSQLIELCRPDLQAMARRTEEKAPELSQKGLQVQAELNIKILNKLKEALEDQDQAKMIAAVKETIEMIRRRNSELVLLDKNPGALRTVEKLEAISALAGGTTATDSARMLAMMTQLAAEDNQKPRYRQPNGHQWFRAAGSFQGTERVRDNYGFNTQNRTGGPRSQSVEQSYGKSPQRCFNCHRTGHFAAHCKQRAQ